MAKTRGRNTRKRAFTERYAYGRALGAHLRELALGAAPLAPGAQDRTTGTLFRVRVRGGSRVGVLCDRFEVCFCCFYLLSNWNKLGFIETLIF